MRASSARAQANTPGFDKTEPLRSLALPIQPASRREVRPGGLVENGPDVTFCQSLKQCRPCTLRFALHRDADCDRLFMETAMGLCSTKVLMIPTATRSEMPSWLKVRAEWSTRSAVTTNWAAMVERNSWSSCPIVRATCWAASRNESARVAAKPILNEGVEIRVRVSIGGAVAKPDQPSDPALSDSQRGPSALPGKGGGAEPVHHRRGGHRELWRPTLA